MKILATFLTSLLLLTHLASAQQPELILPKGHSDFIHNLKFTSDGKYLMSQSYKEVIVWNYSKGVPLYQIAGHEFPIMTSDISPDDKLIATGSEDATIKLWNLSSGTLVETIGPFYGPVFNVTFCGNRELIYVYGDMDRFLVVAKYDLASKKVVSKTSHKFDNFDSFAVSAADWTTCLVGIDNRVYKCHLTGGEWERLENHRIGLNAISISPDGKKAITGTSGGYLEWQLANNASTKLISYFQPVSTTSFDNISQSKIIKDYPNSDYYGNSIKFLDNENFITASGSNSTGQGKIRFVDKAHRSKDVPEWKSYAKEITIAEQLYSLAISPDNKYIAAGSNKIYVWAIDRLEGKPIKELKGISLGINALDIDPSSNNALIAVGSESSKGRFQNFAVLNLGDNQIGLIDLETGQPKEIKFAAFGKISNISYSRDGKYFTYGADDGTLSVWESAKFKPYRTFINSKGSISAIGFNPNNNNIIAAYDKGQVLGWSLFSDNRMQIPNTSFVYSLDFITEKKVVMGGSHIGIADWTSGAMSHRDMGEPYLPITKIRVINKDTIVYSDYTGKVTVFSPDKNFDEFKSHKFDNSILSFDISNSHKLIAVGTGNVQKYLTGEVIYKNSLTVCEFPTFNNCVELGSHGTGVNNLKFSRDDRFIYSIGQDGLFKIWDEKKRSQIASLIVLDSLNWITITPDNYYMASKKAASLINFRVGQKIYSFSEFDLQFNRPDTILARIGLSSPELIDQYRQAYFKRLEKLKINRHKITLDFHQPEVKILENDFNPDTENPIMKFNIDAHDDKYKLTGIHLYVNEIPIWGLNGLDIRKLNTSALRKEINFRLSSGNNKIEITVINENGVAAKREGFDIYYRAPSKKTTLYVVSIGVSNYKDSSKVLKYAHKDANDLINQFKTRSFEYEKVIPITLPENETTRTNILRIREKLLETEVDDKVIVLFSGHGLLNQANNQWYYGTYDVNFSKPSENGLSYNEIESLLDGIPARNKLLLLDACYSGELDNKSTKNLSNSVAKNDQKTKGGKGPIVVTSSSSTNRFIQSVEMMKMLFADLGQNTGTTIISAASGDNRAYENDQLKNGYFTYALLDGLLEKKADSNHDGTIVISELRNYIYRTVLGLSNGSQVPTTRQENLTTDFQIW